jgi:hypothetical protein
MGAAVSDLTILDVIELRELPEAQRRHIAVLVHEAYVAAFAKATEVCNSDPEETGMAWQDIADEECALEWHNDNLLPLLGVEAPRP